MIVSARDLRLDDVVLLDARPGASAFAAGHLRGAQHADLNVHLSAASDPEFDPSRGGRHPLPPLDRWLQQLGEWGITPSTRVVIYDELDASNAAARAWWMLRAIGHENVAVLDGGYRAAIEAGVETQTGVSVSHKQQPPYPATAWQWPTVGMQRVDELRNDSDWKILDVRSSPRFRGVIEPIDPIAGHIPGAWNLPFAENLENDRFKSADALREQYTRFLDGTPPDHLIVHCGSGVTACHTLLALDLAGFRGAALYVGSWSEWCRRN
ncbi:MAG TPA: sulfurtransferase [Thermoanaerobaculia bacterium]|nr:sulfurtransferase [Thermoanaerobaculia bacterium]